MYSGLTLVTPPASEPISVADAKAHSRISVSADDSVIAGYIASARDMCEKILKRALMPQSWRFALENWPGRNYVSGQMASSLAEYQRWNHIEVPNPPLVSITSFTYKDTNGVSYNMTQGYGNAVGNYLLDLECEPGRIVLPFSGLWPTTILLPASPILITYACGYPSYVGTVDVSTAGVATWKTGAKFVPALAGTWININGGSYVVLTVTDDQHLQLAAGPAVAIPGGAYTANEVPMPIRHAILFLVGHFYENRESVVVGRTAQIAVEIPYTVDNLLSPYRVMRFAA